MPARPVPRKAVVLAAGLGTRLLPLTRHCPKPLLPVWGQPALFRTLNLLHRWGVREVLINLHHGADRILRSLLTRPHGPQVSLSFEPELLGTGGILRRAVWFLDREPFWMINADILAELSPHSLLAAFAGRHPLAVLWLHPTAGPRTVIMRHGRILSLRAPHPGQPGTYTFCGLQLLTRAILDYLPNRPVCSIVEAYENALRDGEELMGVVVPGAFWADLGTPSSYLAAHAAWAAWQSRATRRRVSPSLAAVPASHRCTARPRITGFAALGQGVHIARSATLENVVLWDGARVEPGARLRDIVVADGVSLRGRAEYLALRADQVADADLDTVLGRLGWSPAHTTVLPLPPRGSAREFWRLRHGTETVMLIRYSRERIENTFYARQGRFLRRLGVPVPRIVLDFPERSLLVLEDAGHSSLQDLATSLAPRRLLTLYETVLQQIEPLHRRGAQLAAHVRLPLSPPFTPRLYRWEHALFCEEFLLRHVTAHPDRVHAISQELRRLIPSLATAPRVLLHRDLQSSNILIRHRQPVFVDFQGMRLGPLVYDLASLLCDPYVELPSSLVESLLHQCCARWPEQHCSPRLFWTAVVQRLAQALGAYGRLGANPATSAFQRHIPAGVRTMLQALRHLGGFPILTATLESVPVFAASGAAPCA